MTHLRYFGYCMNPVSFYYCFAPDGEAVEAIIAEIHNTPWGERHCYVLDCRAQGTARGRWSFDFAKEFHVSPFMPMDVDYAWRLTRPGRVLCVHMENRRGGETMFDATMTLERRPITTASLSMALARHPFMTGAVITAIYAQALRLWWKGAPAHPHPGAKPGATSGKAAA